jgi:hypothetical protein
MEKNCGLAVDECQVWMPSDIAMIFTVTVTQCPHQASKLKFRLGVLGPNAAHPGASFLHRKRIHRSLRSSPVGVVMTLQNLKIALKNRLVSGH